MTDPEWPDCACGNDAVLWDHDTRTGTSTGWCEPCLDERGDNPYEKRDCECGRGRVMTRQGKCSYCVCDEVEALLRGGDQ